MSMHVLMRCCVRAKRRTLLGISACRVGSINHAKLQENVDMMSEYMDLDRFKAVYVVDLCHSLCQVAKQKVQQKGWKNVHIVEGDACTFQPPEGIATLVTFSYSLSSRPSS